MRRPISGGRSDLPIALMPFCAYKIIRETNQALLAVRGVKGEAMAIMESDLFRSVSQRFITRIANGAEEQNYKKNSVIFKEGRTGLPLLCPHCR